MRKRGPKVGDAYPVVGSFRMTPELDDLARRRTQSFLDHIGLHDRPIAFLLREAWLQGVKDASEALSSPTQ
jgi:hypothetical protein